MYRVLRHARNEELLSAVITLERKLPSPVARVQGNQLRPPTETNVDVPLVCCSVLQGVQVWQCCGYLRNPTWTCSHCVAVCCSVLQCLAVSCSVLQCHAVSCSVVLCIAVCYSVLQCVAAAYRNQRGRAPGTISQSSTRGHTGYTHMPTGLTFQNFHQRMSLSDKLPRHLKKILKTQPYGHFCI